MPADQKRTPNLITDGCEPPCGLWELNSGPLEEQSVLLTLSHLSSPGRIELLKGKRRNQGSSCHVALELAKEGIG